jgi:hypothetical protein
MEKEKTTIELNPVQFKSLLTAIDYISYQLKTVADRLGKIEDELRGIKNKA